MSKEFPLPDMQEGFTISFMEDKNMTRGKALLFIHPDDVPKKYKKESRDDTISKMGSIKDSLDALKDNKGKGLIHLLTEEELHPKPMGKKTRDFWGVAMFGWPLDNLKL